MLMAIFIVSVLATIIIVGIGSVRSSSNATKCVANIRQWGAALHLYIDDNGGIFPASRYPANTHYRLAKYMTMPESWTPSMLNETVGCPVEGWKYGFNSFLSELPRAVVSDPSRQIYAMDLCYRVNDNRWIDATVLGKKVVALKEATPKPHSGKVAVLYVGGNAGLKYVSELHISDFTKDTPAYKESDDDETVGNPSFDQ
jgi:hypothetical protein